MKKSLMLLFTGIAIAFAASAQYVNIPDNDFRNMLKRKYPACFNAADMMDTTCSAIVNEDTLVVDPLSSVASLQGLQYFKNLIYLNLSFNGSLTTVDEFPATLQYLACMNSALTALPALPAGLLSLNCEYCPGLTALPSLPAGLKYLNCNQCYGLTGLPSLPAGLRYLNCNLCEFNILPPLPAGLTALICSSNSSLSSLPALPVFLDTLDCSGCTVTSLPALPDGLTYLDCGTCSLTSLPLLPASLKFLNCRDNPLLSLPALPAGLIFLHCSNSYSYTYSPITSLPLLPASLKYLSCGNHQLSSLPALPQGLRDLQCEMNLITSLPALPASLINLSVGANKLQSLPALPDSLRSLMCSSNPLHLLPPLPDSLKILYCSEDSLTQLPALPQYLSYLECENNQLTGLPPLPFLLQSLWVRNNDIYCLPKLPIPVSSDGMPYATMEIYFDSDKIKCVPNYDYNFHFYGLNSQSVNLPLCNPTNNIQHCESFPVMAGTVFYDNNSNGIRDAGEPVKTNSPVSLSNSNYSFSNSNGYYEIGADNIGVYTLSTNPPAYFNAVPATYTYNFINYDTLVTNNFALQANAVVDSLAIRISPINWAARPGFSFPYLVNYENAGTRTLSPNIVFNFDITKLTYDSSSNTSIVNNGTNISLPVGSFVPGQHGSFVAYFTIKTTASLGDSLFAKAVISANGNTYPDSMLTTIRGAFDPNDKQATPQLSPLQVAAGKYIDYTIRFQNTGTDTAFNIVITDTLNGNLQANTLQMLSSSHNCKATVKNNIVFFEFLNILLPDSNVNESKSHGFVSFRIKPQSSVAENTIIPNKAAIYFDYNSPVITNTATTEIKTPLIPVPLKLQLFSAVKQTENTAIVSWSTSNEINTMRFIIEQSFDGRNFTSIAYENAKGRQYNTYSRSISIPAAAVVCYRLKIIDIDGQFTYSPVVALRKNKGTEPFTIITNPIKDVLTIAVQDAGLRNTVVKIISGQGAVLQTGWLQNNIEIIDVSKLPAGMYILQTEKGSRQFMLVK